MRQIEKSGSENRFRELSPQETLKWTLKTVMETIGTSSKGPVIAQLSHALLNTLCNLTGATIW